MRPVVTPNSGESKVAPRETERAMRLPWTTRAKRSRPRWSVPRRCSSLGGRKRLIGASAIGLWRATKGAKIATRSTATTRTSPMTPSGSASSRRSALRRRRRGRAVAVSLALEAMAHPRIEPGDHQIGQHIDQDEEEGGDQHRAADDRVVAGQDGVIDQLADAGP